MYGICKTVLKLDFLFRKRTAVENLTYVASGKMTIILRGATYSDYQG